MNIFIFKILNTFNEHKETRGDVPIYLFFRACVRGPNNPGRNSSIALSSSCKNKDKNNASEREA